MTVTDPLTCPRTWHPSVPNVADLRLELDVAVAQVAALTGYLDRAVLDLARTRGTSVEVERLRLGLPARPVTS